MIKCPSPDNMQQAADCIDTKQATFQAAVLGTFNEVYDNMDAIEGKIGGFQYIPEEKTLVFPSSGGTGKEG